MPSWWAKSSSKDANKKSNKGSLISTIHKKFRIVSEGKCNSGSGGFGKQFCDAKYASRSPVSPSSQVSRCESFTERPQPLPLPLPAPQHTTKHRVDSSHKEASEAEVSEGSRSFFFLPLPKPSFGPDPVDAEADVGTASVSSDKSTDSDNPSDSRLLSPQAPGYKNGKKAATNSPFSVTKMNWLPNSMQKSSREKLKPTNTSLNNQVPTSHKTGRLSSHVPNSQISHHGAIFSALDSKMFSTSRSPVRVFGPELVMNSGGCAGKSCVDLTMLGSGHCYSPGSGQNSVGVQHSRYSPTCSPIPSPRMTSPGPSSRIHSGGVTPLHPRARGAIELPAEWPDGKHQGHRLPLPPIKISNTYPSLTETTPVPRSPSRAENPTYHGPLWKKGKLLGQGTFGHVYLGFDSENGEMCAMKEVTLYSDDAKSKESARQLEQEVALLSRLRHPSIVQYLGSEVVNDKQYIYLEYVSGGSIYKILRDYGQLGESAIRSYTQQILSGLAYLHARNTIHRDIKGANLLVDPNGRVKLADFGMAKQISGPSCQLSFKGSSYWMAPEIIRNSKECNLAVDIWSLGCTVLEMATAKPPWSQFEAAAAMFKIGNTEELPDIPESLSDDGKDFVRRCLQRNPLNRPSAAQLLEHPFVKYAAPPERPMPCLEPSKTMLSADGYGHARYPSCCDRKGATTKHSRPLAGGGAIPFQFSKQPPSYLHEGMGTTSRSQKNFGSKNCMPYKELQPKLSRGPSKAHHVYQEAVQSKKGSSSGVL